MAENEEKKNLQENEEQKNTENNEVNEVKTEKEEAKFTQVKPSEKTEKKEEKKTTENNQAKKPTKTKEEKTKNEKVKKEKPIKEKGKKRNIFARIVAIIILLAIVIGIIVIALPSPARALEEMFRDLKAGKMSDIDKYVDYNSLIDIPALGNLEGADSADNDKILYEDLQWNIKKIEKNEEEAKIEVEITNKNYKNIFQNFTKKVVQKILNNEKPSDEEAGQYLMEELKNKEVGQTTTTQEITIRKEEGKWKVVVDENLQNAIFPGLSEAVNGYGE
jgi:hypothetical protein CRE_29518